MGYAWHMGKVNEYNAGERLYMGHGTPEEERRHIERYDFAAKHLTGGMRVLDAASGSGYGSAILASNGMTTVGLELSGHAVGFAHSAYGLDFRQADLNTPLDFPDESFDAVVSFETLEHVHNQKGLIAEFRRVLKYKGLLIISTPDKNVLTGMSGGDNKFHVAELTKAEFWELLCTNGFSSPMFFGQTKYVPLSAAKRRMKMLAKLDVFGFKRMVTRAFGLQRTVHGFFNSEEDTGIRPLKGSYYQMIAVARKDG